MFFIAIYELLLRFWGKYELTTTATNLEVSTAFSWLARRLKEEISAEDQAKQDEYYKEWLNGLNMAGYKELINEIGTFVAGIICLWHLLEVVLPEYTSLIP